MLKWHQSSRMERNFALKSFILQCAVEISLSFSSIGNSAFLLMQ